MSAQYDLKDLCNEVDRLSVILFTTKKKQKEIIDAARKKEKESRTGLIIDTAKNEAIYHAASVASTQLRVLISHLRDIMIFLKLNLEKRHPKPFPSSYIKQILADIDGFEHVAKDVNLQNLNLKGLVSLKAQLNSIFLKGNIRSSSNDRSPAEDESREEISDLLQEYINNMNKLLRGLKFGGAADIGSGIGAGPAPQAGATYGSSGDATADRKGAGDNGEDVKRGADDGSKYGDDQIGRAGGPSARKPAAGGADGRAGRRDVGVGSELGAADLGRRRAGFGGTGPAQRPGPGQRRQRPRSRSLGGDADGGFGPAAGADVGSSPRAGAGPSVSPRGRASAGFSPAGAGPSVGSRGGAGPGVGPRAGVHPRLGPIGGGGPASGSPVASDPLAGDLGRVSGPAASGPAATAGGPGSVATGPGAGITGPSGAAGVGATYDDLKTVREAAAAGASGGREDDRGKDARIDALIRMVAEQNNKITELVRAREEDAQRIAHLTAALERLSRRDQPAAHQRSGGRPSLLRRLGLRRGAPGAGADLGADQADRESEASDAGVRGRNSHRRTRVDEQEDIEVRRRIITLERENRRLQTDLRESEEQRATTRKLEDDNRRLRERLDGTEEDINKMRGLQRENAELKARLQEATSVGEDRKHSDAALREALQRAQKAESERDAALGESEKHKLAASAQKRRADGLEGELDAERKGLMDKNSKLQTDLRSAQEGLSALEADKEKARRAAASLVEQNRELQSKLSAADQAARELERKSSGEIEGLRRELQSEREAHRRSIDELRRHEEAALGEKSGEVRSRDDQLRALNERIHALERENKTLEENKNTAERQYRLLDERFHRSNDEHNGERDRTRTDFEARMRAMREEMEGELNRLRAGNRDLLDGLDRARREAVTAKTEAADAETTLRRLGPEYERIRGENDRLNLQLRGAAEAIDALKEQKRNAELARDAALGEAERARRAHQAAEDEKNRAFAALREIRAQLEADRAAQAAQAAAQADMKYAGDAGVGAGGYGADVKDARDIGFPGVAAGDGADLKAQLDAALDELRVAREDADAARDEASDARDEADAARDETDELRGVLQQTNDQNNKFRAAYKRMGGGKLLREFPDPPRPPNPPGRAAPRRG